MKKSLRVLVLGVAIIAMLTGTVLGAQIKKTIEVVYNSVNITVNGERVATDNILYEGTTYVPLRAVSEMLGKEVGWDGDTRTASIDDVAAKVPVKENPIENPGETVSQKNAIKSAKDYLDYTSFSKQGLIKQLEYEGFSNEDATYGVNQINVDWKEQAAISAKGYLEYTSFSRSGLIKQLEHEGFTNEEAIYGVDKMGL